MKTVFVFFVLSCLLARSVMGAYDPKAAVAWLRMMGCQNVTITNCPGNRLCTDAEFYARALAAGGAIDLNPNHPMQAPYVNYMGKYNLCLSEGLIKFLQDAKWAEKSSPKLADFTMGAIAFTQMWFPGMAYFAVAPKLCDSHTPITGTGVHCGMPCDFFIPRVLFHHPNRTA